MSGKHIWTSNSSVSLVRRTNALSARANAAISGADCQQIGVGGSELETAPEVVATEVYAQAAPDSVASGNGASL